MSQGACLNPSCYFGRLSYNGIFLSSMGSTDTETAMIAKQFPIICVDASEQLYKCPCCHERNTLFGIQLHISREHPVRVINSTPLPY